MHDDCKVLWMMHVHETLNLLFENGNSKWCKDANCMFEIRVKWWTHVLNDETWFKEMQLKASKFVLKHETKHMCKTRQML